MRAEGGSNPGALGDPNDPIVPTSIQPPAIQSTPNLFGQIDEPYSYDDNGTVEAVGEGILTFETIGAPSGFAIDPATGAVSWTPDNEGVFTITLKVSNTSGSVTQTYPLTVNQTGAPPEPPPLPVAPPAITSSPSLQGTVDCL